MGANTKDFVSFSEVKKQVSMTDILDHYDLIGYLTKTPAGAYVGKCPIHEGTNSKQFKVDPVKNCWYCFGSCKKGGNILDFVSMIENVSVRDGALLIVDWFDLKKTNGAKKKIESVEKPPAIQEREKQGKLFNHPLKFKGLSGLETSHDSLVQIGFLEEKTLGQFETGYFSGKGIMKNRIAIPIHNSEGVLVGYAGRDVGEKGGYKYAKDFKSELEVYNFHRAQKSAKNSGFVFLVPDYLDVWRMYEAGFENVVSCIGEVPSNEQIELLFSLLDEESQKLKAIWVLTCNDLDSQEGLNSFTFLSQKFFMKFLQLGSVVSEMNPMDLRKAINRS